MSVRNRLSDSFACCRLALLVMLALAAGCTPTGDTTPPDDTLTDNTTADVAHQDSAADVALSIVYVRSADRFNRAARQVNDPVSTPCPHGGSFTENADGSITFNDCSVFPGTPLNGSFNVTPQEGDTQGGIIELDNITGRNSRGREFSTHGTIEVIENPDGSLTFKFDWHYSTTFEGETDEIDINGEISVTEDGTMSGSLELDSNFPGLPPTPCNYDGFNVFDSSFDEGEPCDFPGLDEQEDFGNEPKACMTEDDCFDSFFNLSLFCDNGFCVECRSNDDCMNLFEQICVAGECTPCKSDQECKDGGLGNKCFGEGRCVECENNSDCDSGEICDDATSECMPEDPPVAQPLLTDAAIVQYGDYDLAHVPGTRLLQLGGFMNPAPDLEDYDQNFIVYFVGFSLHDDSLDSVGFVRAGFRVLTETGEIFIESYQNETGRTDFFPDPSTLPIAIDPVENVQRPLFSWDPSLPVFAVTVQGGDNLYGIVRVPSDAPLCTGCIVLKPDGFMPATR